ncbi:MAG TPA: hypothetical protein VI381_04700 [Allosphingosinicella sp.]
MTSSPTTLERAFELARSGECAAVADIRARLKQERHDQVEAHLAGPSINRQLRALCEEARRSDAACRPGSGPI